MLLPTCVVVLGCCDAVGTNVLSGITTASTTTGAELDGFGVDADKYVECAIGAVGTEEGGADEIDEGGIDGALVGPLPSSANLALIVRDPTQSSTILVTSSAECRFLEMVV